MSLVDAKYALTEAVLAAIATIPLDEAHGDLSPMPVSRENAPFEKPVNAKWAAFYYLANQPQAETLGDAGEDMATGIAQVDIYYPAGRGDADCDTDLEIFRAAFKAGHGFTHNGQSIVVRNCGTPRRRLEDNWFIVSVTIGWYALVPR